MHSNPVGKPRFITSKALGISSKLPGERTGGMPGTLGSKIRHDWCDMDMLLYTLRPFTGLISILANSMADLGSW